MNRQSILLKSLFAQTCPTKLFVFLLVCRISFPTAFALQQAEVTSLDAHIPLPGVEGRIDHLSVDAKGQRFFVAAVDNHTLEVIDVKSNRRIHTIKGLPEPQGVFYDAATNHLFLACA